MSMKYVMDIIISDRKLSDYSTVFARWRQQLKNGRVTLGFAAHF